MIEGLGQLIALAVNGAYYQLFKEDPKQLGDDNARREFANRILDKALAIVEETEPEPPPDPEAA